MNSISRRQFAGATLAAGTAAGLGVFPRLRAEGANLETPAAAPCDPRTHPSSGETFLDYPLPEGDHAALRRTASEARSRDPRPNILWVFTDQQTWNALSCAGNPNLFTPNMDRLAQRGIRFSNCSCASPVCGPSRASMVTGRMPHESGVHFNGETPDPSVPSMGEVFREAGYQTYWSGKWHLPESYHRASTEMRGFTNLRLPGGLKGRGLGDATDMLFTGDATYLLKWHLALSPQPWLYTVSLHNPHDICAWCASKPLSWEGVDNLPPLPPNHAIPENEPEYLSRHRREARYGRELPFAQDWSEADWRAYLKAYYSMTEAVDRCLGHLLDALESGGWMENTLVLFTSDHGEGVAAHKWVCKLAFYEECLRVPMILSWPGHFRRGVVDDSSLTSTLDIFPTFCDVAGINPPPHLRGRSLRPAAEGTGPVEREAVYAHLANRPSEPESQGRMVRTQRFKYNAYSWGANPEELFDLHQDPGETHNLAHHPESQEPLARHRALLERWLLETGDPFHFAFQA